MNVKTVLATWALFLVTTANAQSVVPCENEINQVLQLHNKATLALGDYEFFRNRRKYSYQEITTEVQDGSPFDSFDLSIESKAQGNPGKELARRYMLERELSKVNVNIERLETLSQSLPVIKQSSKKARKWAGQLRHNRRKQQDIESRLAQPEPAQVESIKIFFTRDDEIQLFRYEKSWQEQSMGLMDLATCKLKETRQIEL
jgi:hypothetical protein